MSVTPKMERHLTLASPCVRNKKQLIDNEMVARCGGGVHCKSVQLTHFQNGHLIRELALTCSE